jgi:NAD-dependent DNA ligase
MKAPDPHQILLSKAKHLTREYVENLTDKQAWELVYTIKTPAKPKETGPVVCFTGFSGEEEAPLKLLAQEHGFKVTEKVIKSLTHLVTGLTPGPKKMEEAAKLKCKILSAEEFIQDIQR